ncbi:lycopene cyclase domain-containing protein [Arthrobacter sp. EH-1B-1]|uniref:Lycopene cyclase domain-containing protein n=1 Tax=Arthrobacter vasquezii TaxID=2977629 RepID=A0ABT6CX62_9MICC|nr:lycopene cyclase domain-containing protein [Arthrobacter vasquezii]MDF9278604.1 lycopene cyclase domain-containing protein [Arthrobacter vasquezii]
MGAAYLLFLLISLGCMVLLDQRLRLFFWHDARRAAVVLITGVLFFLVWDLAGIGLGIFYRGTAAMTGVMLAPELPLEEPIFLAFLCYLVMNLFLWFRRIFTERSSSPRDARQLSDEPGGQS